MSALALYDAARKALAEARSFDEVLAIRNRSEQMRLYARQAKDRELMADAAEIQLRAERRFGELWAAATAAGEVGPGRPEKGASDGTISKVTLDDIGVDKKFSSHCGKLASISEQALDKIVQQRREAIMATGAIAINPQVRTAVKQERRAAIEADLGRRQRALPAEKFGVVYADPEWRFEPWSRVTGMDRAAENHYPTSAIEVIAARPVASLAANDAVLFLWATVPMLLHAALVMGAWGFDYASHYVWIKEDHIGTGYWSRNAHELLLIGTKGKPPAPAPGTQWPSYILAPVGRHSAKPEEFYRLIEAYYPTLPKIELNARGPARQGWVAWGNEAQPAEAAE